MVISSRGVLPLFFLVTFLGAIIVGPLLYFALAGVYPIPFHRAMDRALLICAVGGLGLFASRISWRKLWPPGREAWKQLLLGYAMAAVSVQAMIGFHAAFVGFTGAHLDASAIAARILLAATAAILIPPLEETVFRGFVQGELVRALGWRTGWILGAILFMLAHFLKIPPELDRQPVHIWSGGSALIAAFSHLGQEGGFQENLGRGLNLMLVGLILGGAFLRAGSLWLNAGLHSGWIFALLLFTGLTRPVDRPHVKYLGLDILSSPITAVVLILLGFWLWRFYRHPSILPEIGPSAP